MIEIIIFYRLIDSTEEGTRTSHTQYNEVTKTFNIAKYYRRQFLEDLGKYMRKSIEENKVNNIALMGDINEHVEDKTVIRFMNENGLVNVHNQVNKI